MTQRRSKILASTFGRFRLYRLRLKILEKLNSFYFFIKLFQGETENFRDGRVVAIKAHSFREERGLAGVQKILLTLKRLL